MAVGQGSKSSEAVASAFSGPTTRARKRLLDESRRPPASREPSGGVPLPPRSSSRRKRPLRGPGSSAEAAELCLYVRLTTSCGRTRVHRLPLEPIDSVGDLRGLFRRLITGAFESEELPDYLASERYVKYTPREEFVSVPGDSCRTQFRLAILGSDGWEHTLAERDWGGAPDPVLNMLVTVAEFESDAFRLADDELVLNLVSYPTVCVRRAFLNEALRRLRDGLPLKGVDGVELELEGEGGGPSTSGEAGLGEAGLGEAGLGEAGPGEAGSGEAAEPCLAC